MNNRKSIRLKDYDYSQQGIYFVTICLQNRKSLFGEIDNGIMYLNEVGTMIQTQWLALLQQFDNIDLHSYVVMPNHFHAMIEMVGVPLVGTQTKTLGDVIGAFKSITTNQYIMGVKMKNWEPFEKKLWQRNYWEHIVRDENDYLKISEYILNNPQQWDIDKLNPDFTGEIHG